ncbi:Calcium-activated potassium channel slowpoke [Smittium mucronatum]|uniref:Calcium-activated potassium channel slowpoke n=1 Tax=Smittium mucronatum TaxID=133383 RepID=A0A1R0GYL8_9FUNG|nr:Calcium-activated potassium channel slowpoke [Smittium mucronatum]
MEDIFGNKNLNVMEDLFGFGVKKKKSFAFGVPRSLQRFNSIKTNELKFRDQQDFSEPSNNGASRKSTSKRFRVENFDERESSFGILKKAVVANLTTDINTQIESIMTKGTNGEEARDLPTSQQLFSFYLNTSSYGYRWYQADVIVNLAMVFLYIINTTFITETNNTVPKLMLNIDAILSAMLFLIFIPRLIMSTDTRRFIKSDFFISSMFTCLTPWAILINIHLNPSVYSDTFMSSGVWSFLYPVRFYRLSYVLAKILKSLKTVCNIRAITQIALQSIANVAITLLTITSFTHTMIYLQRKSPSEEVMDFGDVLFFTAVSSVTGLTSDVAPDTLFTKGVAVLIVFLGIVWMPPKISEILNMIEEKTPDNLKEAFIPEPNQNHVLVIGDLSYSSLVEFLREFFCEDHGPQIVNTKVILMNETGPDKESELLISDPLYEKSVSFVLGSPTRNKDLDAVRAKDSKSIFLLSKKNSHRDEPEAEDSHKVLISLAISRYLMSLNTRVPIYAQIMLPETSLYLRHLAKEVICIPELRLGILAQGSQVPGFSSLLQALMTSIPSNTEKQLIKIVRERPNLIWLNEYIHGLGQEIYSTKFSSFYKGMTFSEISKYIFTNYSSTLFAIKVENAESSFYSSSRDSILINPTNYVLEGSEIGFIISSDSYVTHCIRNAPTLDFCGHSENGDENEPLLPQDAGINFRGFEESDSENNQYLNNLQSAFSFGKKVKAGKKKRKIKHYRGVSYTSYFDSYDGGGKLINDISGVKKWSGSNELKSMMKLFRDPGSATIKSFERASLHSDPQYIYPDRETKSFKHNFSIFDIEDNQNLKIKEGELPINLKNHVVICVSDSKFPRNMEYLLGSIRSSALGAHKYENDGEKTPCHNYDSYSSGRSQKSNTSQRISNELGIGDEVGLGLEIFPNPQPIVFLTQEMPNDSEKNLLEKFENVYFVEGSPLSKSDMVRSRIMTASSAIVLTDSSIPDNEGQDEATSQKNSLNIATSDAPSLIVVLNIESLTCNNNNFMLCVELNHRENMKYIGENSPLEINSEYIQSMLRPCFMSGNCYAPVMLDTLICQSFYNENLIPLLKKLVFPRGSITKIVEHSKIIDAGLSKSDLPQLFTDSKVPQNSNLFMVPVPKIFVGGQYMSLFLEFSKKFGALCLGIYRNSDSVLQAKKDRGPTTGQSDFNAFDYNVYPTLYFVANPSSKTELVWDDQIYVLSGEYPEYQL